MEAMIYIHSFRKHENLGMRAVCYCYSYSRISYRTNESWVMMMRFFFLFPSIEIARHLWSDAHVCYYTYNVPLSRWWQLSYRKKTWTKRMLLTTTNTLNIYRNLSEIELRFSFEVNNSSSMIFPFNIFHTHFLGHVKKKKYENRNCRLPIYMIKLFIHSLRVIELVVFSSITTFTDNPAIGYRISCIIRRYSSLYLL